MFRQIELDSFQVELFLEDYLVKGNLQPRGDMLTYLNDRNWLHLPLRNAELFSLASDRRVASIKKESTSNCWLMI